MRSGWPQLSSWSRHCCPAFLFKSLLLCGRLFPAPFAPSLCKDSSIIVRKRSSINSSEKGIFRWTVSLQNINCICFRSDHDENCKRLFTWRGMYRKN
ncbi:hypothetical protein V1520DRAFT_372343 [Lipomyces starkeyi]|uniref:Secreted protein n=1 Tax=Lipomyces starkeyi NRRL Y-11557 TaxID=675824 RepID=A0A1E3Q3N3_LIPST|nr:hypothetical protein LIPSTDRAFT_331316 [Lipomyces starkeyi NRRL Y-11557]